MESYIHMSADELVHRFENQSDELLSNATMGIDELAQRVQQLGNISRLLHFKISETRRRRDMPCEAAIASMRKFTSQFNSMREDGRNIQQILHDIHRRTELIEELGARREVVDGELEANVV